MQQESRSQPIELNKEIAQNGEVCFDPEAIILTGNYEDEISLFRARRVWNDALESNFLLDAGEDFQIKVKSKLGEGQFSLQCEFLSACARYAFWRLINNQAPEAQYMIETAHIPFCESHQDEFVGAADLKQTPNSSLLSALGEDYPLHLQREGLLGKISQALRKVLSRRSR